ncbi:MULTISPECIES: YbaK/EbsC family protein [Peptoniphilus]|uniref:YbaK/EbsC family protein n=1 Tax=Peptoniphilus TaxID=162289 RepID=UPI000303075C|nr:MULTISPECIES: YbaK/EbsC family protein [Peptoniphilus]
MNEKTAYELLDKYNISYVRFDHEPIETLIGNLNLVEGQQVKNLVLKNKKAKNIYFIIIEESKELNISELGEKIGEKRLSFASLENLDEYLKCKVSAVTPLGLFYDENKKVKVLIDDSLDINTTLGIHPFINTTTLNIEFKDLLRFFDELEVEYEFINMD